MDLSFSPEHLAFREEVRAFLRSALPPHLREKAAVDGNFDHHEIMEWHRILFERGWVAPHWPAEHGGPGLDITQRFILTEELELSGAPTLSVFGLSMVGPLLIQFGTPAQQKRFLPRISAGDEVWCQGYSEPNAGSDLASLKTRAEDDGKGTPRVWSVESRLRLRNRIAQPSSTRRRRRGHSPPGRSPHASRPCRAEHRGRDYQDG